MNSVDVRPTNQKKSAALPRFIELKTVSISSVSKSNLTLVRSAVYKLSYLPIANPRSSAQLGGTPYHSQSYIRVRSVVFACGEGQTHTQTNRLAWPLYISRRLRLTRNVITETCHNYNGARITNFACLT